MTRRLIIMFYILILLTGCLNKHILDSIRIVTAVGFDQADGNQYEVTAVVPRFNPDKTTSSETYTSFADLTRDAHEQLNMSDSKPFVSGKVEVVLASQELAQDGLIHLTDGFLRDPSVGSKVFLAITEGPTKDLLEGQYSTQDNGMFISELLTQNMEAGPLPNTNLHVFFNHYYDKGRDPYLPLLALKNGKISIMGLALLKNDKMIGKLDHRYLFMFKTLTHRKTKGDQILVTLDNGEQASLYKVESNRSIKMSNLNENPKVEYTIDLNLTVREFSGVELKPANVEKIRKKTEEIFLRDGEKLFQNLQELGVDPLGIGAQIRSRNRSWDPNKWQDQYPNIDIQIKPNITISETGIAE